MSVIAARGEAARNTPTPRVSQQEKGMSDQKVTERRILPVMSVRQINARYPSCRAVFARYGMGGCGGDLGPDEPLAFFAEAHQVDLASLTAEREWAAATPEAREELIRAGLRHLAKVRSVPSFVTIEQAAGFHGVDVNALVERLLTHLRPSRVP